MKVAAERDWRSPPDGRRCDESRENRYCHSLPDKKPEGKSQHLRTSVYDRLQKASGAGAGGSDGGFGGGSAPPRSLRPLSAPARQ